MPTCRRGTNGDFISPNDRAEKKYEVLRDRLRQNVTDKRSVQEVLHGLTKLNATNTAAHGHRALSKFDASQKTCDLIQLRPGGGVRNTRLMRKRGASTLQSEVSTANRSAEANRCGEQEAGEWKHDHHCDSPNEHPLSDARSARGRLRSDHSR